MANNQENFPTPTKADLAFFVPEGGLHGYNIAFPGHIKYWRGQYAKAAERVEPAREHLATQILSWLTLDGTNTTGRTPAAAQGPSPEESITPSIAEGYRRYMLGGLAMSRLARSGSVALNMDKPIVDATGKVDMVTDMSIDHMHPDEWPFEPRFHVTFGPKLTGEIVRGDTWSNPSPNLLVCTRYPADITPTMDASLSVRGITIDTERTVSIMPYLIAEHSPQFRSGPGQ